MIDFDLPTVEVDLQQLLDGMLEIGGQQESRLAIIQLARSEEHTSDSSHLGISYAVFWLIKKSDRKSTRLNSSHLGTSHAVFCLKKNILSLKTFTHVYVLNTVTSTGWSVTQL